MGKITLIEITDMIGKNSYKDILQMGKSQLKSMGINTIYTNLYIEEVVENGKKHFLLCASTP